MKKWPLVSIALAFVYLFTLVVPAQAEEEDPPVTFSVLYVSPGQIAFDPEAPYTPDQVIDDAEETIEWAGTITNDTCSGISCVFDIYIAAGILDLRNICDDEVSCAIDIYYKIEIDAVWYDSDGTEPPMLHVNIAGVDDEIRSDCSGPAEWGTCTFQQKAMIPAEDLPTCDPADTDCVSEMFNFHWGSWTGAEQGGNTRLTSIAYHFTISTSPITDGDCEDQWIPGSEFASFTLAATNATGVAANQLSGWPSPGSWVKIEVTDGYWQDDGAGPQRTSLAMQTNLGDALFHPLAGSEFTGCRTGTTAYYVQVPYKGAMRLRVNDTGGNFAANTGTLSIALSRATYDPFPTACDANYEIGTELENRSVSAIGAVGAAGIDMYTGVDLRFGDRQVGGEEIGDRYLMLELVNNPHWDGGAYTYMGEILVDGTWYRVDEFPSATCIVKVDVMGHTRIYFPYIDSITEWKFRAYDSDGNYTNNTGWAGYSLHYVDKLQIYTPGAPAMSCSMYTKGDVVEEIELPANTSASHTLDLEGGNLYAIETSGGPWMNGGADSWGVAISDDGGYNWDTTYFYNYALCASAVDGNHSTVYFQALEGKTYRLRVDDPGGVFSDNTGSITATIYGSSTSIQNWSTCTSDYMLTEMSIPEANRTIPAGNVEGVAVGYIMSGNTYALEITNIHSWSPDPIGLEDRYSTQISDDGGATWQDLATADFVECAVLIDGEAETENERFRVVFVANGNYRLRVRGGDVAFLYPTYSGYLVYKLSTVNPADIDPDDVNPTDGAYIPPEWGTACYEVCQAPPIIKIHPVSFGTLGSVNIPLPNVSDWISYGVCSVTSFISWCPEHTAALLTTRTMFDAREPFGTLLELTDGVTVVQQQVSILTTAGGEGAGQQYTPYSIIMDVGGGEAGGVSTWEGFSPSVDDTPWTGTPLDFSNVDTSFTSTAYSGYYNVCLPVAEPIIGDFNFIFCQTLTVLKSSANWVFVGLQFVFDICCIIGLIYYLKKRWIDPARSAA
jgi:hypothetical protein